MLNPLEYPWIPFEFQRNHDQQGLRSPVVQAPDFKRLVLCQYWVTTGLDTRALQNRVRLGAYRVPSLSVRYASSC